MSRDRRGVALMLTVWLIAVLATIAAAIAGATRASSGIALNHRAHVVGRYAAESGVVLAAAELRERLSTFSDSSARQSYLNSMESETRSSGDVELGDAQFHITYVDVSSRLDVNAATGEQLAKFFSFFTTAAEASRAAASIRAWIEKGDTRAAIPLLPDRQDIRYPALPPSRPLRSLEDLRRIPGVSEELAMASVPLLTVDGDGRVNAATASDTVLAAAAGSLVREPSRILIISRGWLAGQPLTHEIQAVYAIEGTSVVLVRWRERDL